MSDSAQNPLPGDLQFQRAEPLPDNTQAGDALNCVVCKAPIARTYFHAAGQVVCPMCAERIHTGQQAPPTISLGRALLYGLGAAIAGCALYAGVAILFNLEIGIIAIAVGIMVGKAVRKGSNGLGGRPQQVLAVLLTYFAITSSYIPVFIHHAITHRQELQQSNQTGTNQTPVVTESETPQRPRMGLAGALVTMILLLAAAPFFGLTTGIGGLISLFIIFIGLRQAWRLTGRSQILIMGPYETTPAPNAVT